MSFLIAEILVLLVLAALAGGAVTYWWLRRNFVDVSNEYSRYERTLAETERLREHKAEADVRIAALEAEKAQLDTRLTDELAWRSGIEAKLDELQPVSLDPVLGRIDGLDATVGKIRPADLGVVEKGLGEVQRVVAGLEPPNMKPVETKLESLEKRVAALRNADLSKIESRVAATSAAVAALASPDLRPVEQKLDSIDKRVAALRNTDVSTVDAHVRELSESVARVDARLAGLPDSPDLTPVNQRLDAIELALRARPRPAAQPRAKKRTAKSKPKAAQPRHERAGALLKSPIFGEADDLKEISGIGPKLEKMLNDIGVYYFFQVGAWSKADVNRVNDLLDAFPGRIERDGWVGQGRRLAGTPGAANMAGPKAPSRARTGEVAPTR